MNADHVIPKSVAKSRFHVRELGNGKKRVSTYFTARGTIVDPSLLTTVPACFGCNMGKGGRLFIPPSWASRLDELNDLGIGTFRVWRGDAESLREVVR